MPDLPGRDLARELIDKSEAESRTTPVEAVIAAVRERGLEDDKAHRLIGRLWTLERMFYYIYGGWGQGLEMNDFPPSVKYLFSKQIVDESTHEMLYLDAQLKKVGLSPDQVKVVITSHSHLDHIGNIKLFPKAVHVLQKKELYQAWWPEKFQGRQGDGAFVMADFDGPARGFNYLELEGDYDVFGDGSVIVFPTPGHTLGHQSVKVKLPSGKKIVMTGDAVWVQENMDGYPAGINYSVKDYNASIQHLKMIRDLENADLYYGHDMDQYKQGGNKWHR